MSTQGLGTISKDALAQGAGGFDYYSGTTNHTGNWGIVEVVGDAVFTTLTVANTGGASLAGPTFTAGFKFFGDITVIKLASGSVIAYRHSI